MVWSKLPILWDNWLGRVHQPALEDRTSVKNPGAEAEIKDKKMLSLACTVTVEAVILLKRISCFFFSLEYVSDRQTCVIQLVLSIVVDYTWKGFGARCWVKRERERDLLLRMLKSLSKLTNGNTILPAHNCIQFNLNHCMHCHNLAFKYIINPAM